MKMLTPTALVLFIASVSFAAPSGEVHSFVSANGVGEECIITTKLAGGVYTSKDIKQEAKLCALNFYDESTALCPKTWSTSPGTIINDNRQTGLSSIAAEAKFCTGKNNPLKSEAKFKQTMEFPDTSSTYSVSSLMYYHLSRLLNTSVRVPVAVYRTMDASEHYARVSRFARPLGAKNAAGWVHVQAAETNPAGYGPKITDLLTPDFKKIYGILLDAGGVRYGAEINGARTANFLPLQNYGLQTTPAGLALRSPLHFVSGSNSISAVQMNSWMRDLSEIAILDYIVGQDDRVGNIDYKWAWVYLDSQGHAQDQSEKSKLSRAQMASISVPKEIAAFHPLLVQKTVMSDNDAAAYGGLTNFAKTTGALDGVSSYPSVPKHEPIHHLALETYRRLQTLGSDFANGGAVAREFSAAVGLSDSSADRQRFAVIRDNVTTAAKIFRGLCTVGALHFDIVSDEEALRGQTSPRVVIDCANP